MTDPLPTRVAPGLADPVRGDAPGGFAWWYVDLVDEDGNGLVAIVALGLPFLPGYASAARAGTAPAARLRPSVFVQAVRAGRPWFWALHETDPADLVWEPHHARLGASSIEVRLERGGAHLVAELSGVLPGCPWSARIAVDGPLRRAAPGEPASAEHEWTVLTAVADGQATLHAGPHDLRIRGRGYIDRNAGDRSLEALGVGLWTWGRVALPDRERIWYLATGRDGGGRAAALTIGADGATRDEGPPAVVGWRRTGWGLRVPTAVALDGGPTVSLRAPVDDSPFYARFLVDAVDGGQAGRGFAEVCRPDRIDVAWFRPLVRMTVCADHSPGRNSVWLPLFGGPRDGRLARLIGWSR